MIWILLTDISFDLGAEKMEIGSIATEKGSIALIRSGEGQLNIASMMTASPAQALPKSVTPPSPAVPWTVLLKSLVIDGYSVKIADQNLAEPFGITLDEINCKARDISTAKDAKGTIVLSNSCSRTYRWSS